MMKNGVRERGGLGEVMDFVILGMGLDMGMGMDMIRDMVMVDMVGRLSRAK